MTRLSIVISVIAAISLAAANSFAADANSAAAPKTTVKGLAKSVAGQAQSRIAMPKEPNAPAPTALVAEPNKAAEPNDVALKRKLDDLADKEMKEWVRGATEERLGTVGAVNEHSIGDLTYLKAIAAKDGCTSVANAIDEIMAARQKKYDETVQRMREVRAKARKADADEKKQKTIEMLKNQRGVQTPGGQGKMQ